jgi:hypothetical protein
LRFVIGIWLAATLAAAPAVAAHRCDVEHARYALRGAPGITAGFRGRDASGTPDWPVTTFFFVHSSRTDRTWWFLPWPAGSAGIPHLASTTDVEKPGWTPPDPDGGPRPLGDLDFYSFRRDYTVDDRLPTAGGEAPPHIFVPQLGDALRHPPDPDGREDLPIAFFDLVDDCGPTAPPRAEVSKPAQVVVYSNVGVSPETLDRGGFELELRRDAAAPEVVFTTCAGGCYGGRTWPVRIEGRALSFTVTEDCCDGTAVIRYRGRFTGNDLVLTSPDRPGLRVTLKRVRHPVPNQTAELGRSR